METFAERLKELIHKEVEEVIERIKILLPQAQKEQINKLYNLMCSLGNERGLYLSYGNFCGKAERTENRKKFDTGGTCKGY